MSTSLAINRPATLQQAAHSLNRSRRAVGLHQRNALEAAIQCGIYLHYAKTEVKRGEWAAWLERNFEGSQTQAERYMQIARSYSANLSVFKDCGSIDEAHKIARTAVVGKDLPAWLPDLLPPEPARLADPAAF